MVFVYCVIQLYGFNQLIFKLRFPKLVQNHQGADSSAKPNILSNTLVNSVKAFQIFPDSNYFPTLSPSLFLIYMIYTVYMLYISGEEKILHENRAGIN